MALAVRIHDEALSLCQLPDGAAAPADILAHPFTCFFRTHDEATLICPTEFAPKNAAIVSGYIALELVGPFDHALTGILTQIANPLAAAIPIIPLSTFNTDYVLIKADQRAAAIAALKQAGHSFDKNHT